MLQDANIEVRGYGASALQDLIWYRRHVTRRTGSSPSTRMVPVARGRGVTPSFSLQGDWGIDPKILDTARVLFREQDADGRHPIDFGARLIHVRVATDSGTLDEGELFSLICLVPPTACVRAR